jgi:hypothetical protein
MWLAYCLEVKFVVTLGIANVEIMHLSLAICLECTNLLTLFQVIKVLWQSRSPEVLRIFIPPVLEVLWNLGLYE